MMIFIKILRLEIGEICELIENKKVQRTLIKVVSC